MVDSGTPYFFATAQTELEPSMAITTSARNAAGYFFPRRFPGTVFLQYARFFAMLSHLPLQISYHAPPGATTPDICPPGSSPASAAHTATVLRASSSLV